MERRVRGLILGCALVYIAAYVGRLSYAASMVGIMETTGAAKSAAGMVSTLFYLSYGVGQLVNAFFCRRYPARAVVTGVLLVSAGANILSFLTQDVAVIQWLWFLNGAAQSMLWCTLIELISRKVPPENRQSAILAMSITVAIGTTTIYALAALCMALHQVFLTFVVAAVIVAVVAVIWLRLTACIKDMPTNAAAAGTKTTPGARAAFSMAALLGIFGCGALAAGNGFLKDTMVSWVPSLLYDEFSLASSWSVLITLLLPLLSIGGSALALALHRRIKSYTVMEAILFTASAIAFTGVALSHRYHIMVGVILFAAANAVVMASVNNIITSIIPLERGKGAGMFAGIMDAFCYVGSTLSGIVPALIIEGSGFAALILTLAICAAVMAAGALAGSFGGKKG